MYRVISIINEKAKKKKKKKKKPLAGYCEAANGTTRRDRVGYRQLYM